MAGSPPELVLSGVNRGNNAGENVVYSYVEWPDKETRDAGWDKMMKDPDMQPGAQEMPFDGQRMFWGGFRPVLDTAGA